MKVSEFAEWLNGIDQDAEVRCVLCTKHGATEIDFSIEQDKETFEYVDFRGNMLSFGKPNYNKRYLSIGKWI
jgi:hypothetical protein